MELRALTVISTSSTGFTGGLLKLLAFADEIDEGRSLPYQKPELERKNKAFFFDEIVVVKMLSR